MDQVLRTDDRVFWFLEDHQGTTRDLVNNAGKLVTHYVYDAFGEVISGDTSKTRYLYTGRELDSTTGLQYNHNRWYDPRVGRWISEDPIGFERGDYNLSRYVGNMATYMRDPSGLITLSLDLDYEAYGGIFHASGTPAQMNFGIDPWKLMPWSTEFDPLGAPSMSMTSTISAGLGFGFGTQGSGGVTLTTAPSVGDLTGGGGTIQGDLTLLGGGGGGIVWGSGCTYVGFRIGPSSGAAIGVSMDATATGEWFRPSWVWNWCRRKLGF